MKYQGLIPNIQQQEVLLPLPRWKYGEIRDGMKIIDPILHYGCFVLGYENDEIIDFVTDVVKNNKPEIAEPLMPRTYDIRLNHISFEFSNRIYNLTGMKQFFSLSGSDANEGAVKLASAYHYQKGNHHKRTIVGFEKSYHGSTWLTMSIGHDNFMDKPFYTMDPYQSVKRISRDFADDCVDWNSVAAIMIETCAYGADMIPPSPEFWERLDRIRKEHDVLIIIDDVFMGGGKTGDYVGWKKFNIEPDISTMGKAITAGFFPLSMLLYNKKIEEALPKDFRWEHGFTYCFSLAGIASAMKYLDILERDNLLANHDELVKKATAVFENSDYKIMSQFGLHFKVFNGYEKIFYIIPINATDEYFEVLKENLKWFTQNTIR
jgi:adenosylmethionine-8-amino-7-oxononanoate aminotransferase